MVGLMFAMALCVAMGAWAGYVARGLQLQPASTKDVLRRLEEMREAGGLDAETANLAMLALRAERRRLRDAERERAMKHGTR